MIASNNQLSTSALGCFTRSAFAAILIAAISHPAIAQTTTASNATDAPSPPATTLKTDVRRVNVDVVVTDTKGHPLPGLTREDFRIEEDGVPQPIRTFEFYTVDSETPYITPKIPALPANTFLNIAKAPESGTPTVILYDALNMSLSEQAHAHLELLQFIKNRRPGTQVAIFVLGDQLQRARSLSHSQSSEVATTTES